MISTLSFKGDLHSILQYSAGGITEVAKMLAFLSNLKKYEKLQVVNA
jgi:hypothetical protein